MASLAASIIDKIMVLNAFIVVFGVFVVVNVRNHEWTRMDTNFIKPQMTQIIQIFFHRLPRRRADDILRIQ